MANVHYKEILSINMTAIKGKNTKPELLVRNPLTYIFVSLEKLKRYEFLYKLLLTSFIHKTVLLSDLKISIVSFGYTFLYPF